MIGTVICRNCDTAIEVSEGDVTRFRASPVFACSVCHHDLSQRMAELIGRAVDDDPNEEPTIADDDDAYDGLPVGESLDQVAERMRAARSPEPTPVMRNPDATPVMRNPDLPATPNGAFGAPSEDPATLALRIAQQAQAQAQALVAHAMAQVAKNGEDDGSTGVMSVPSWTPPATTPMMSPDAAATAPGSPDVGVVSARVGVVPEEPENEPTVKRGDGESVVEPTAPGVLSSEESTPLLTAQQRADLDREDETAPGITDPTGGALPEAPANEMTPSISSRHSPFVPEEPPHEVTIRKHGAPAPLPKLASIPRTGTGPAGIGALGIRVTTNNRAVVRPVSNGRAVQVPSPAAETQVSALPLPPERPSAPSIASTAPWQAPEKVRRSGGGIPKWAFFAAGGGAAAVVGAFVVANFVGGAKPTPTPMPTAVVVETPDDSATPPPIEVTATPRTTAVAVETPKATATFAMPSLPASTATPLATPASTRTAVAALTATPTPKATTAVVKPTPTPKPRVDVDALRRRASNQGTRPLAMRDFAAAVEANPENEDLLYLAYTNARIYPDSWGYARVFGRLYLQRFGATERGAAIQDWLAKHPDSKEP